MELVNIGGVIRPSNANGVAEASYAGLMLALSIDGASNIGGANRYLQTLMVWPRPASLASCRPHL